MPERAISLAGPWTQPWIGSWIVRPLPMDKDLAVGANLAMYRKDVQSFLSVSWSLSTTTVSIPSEGEEIQEAR
jgi:hypothetical protein